MFKLSQTRWLSRRQVISRIFEQWNVLVEFFYDEAKSDKFDGAGKIYETMKQSACAAHVGFFGLHPKKG